MRLDEKSPEVRFPLGFDDFLQSRFGRAGPDLGQGIVLAQSEGKKGRGKGGGSKLLTTSGQDHIARPLGGGKDTQMVRARLTAISNWDIVTAQYHETGRRPDAAQEWSEYAGLYDQFKVNGMRCSYAYPKYLVGSPTGGIVGFEGYPRSVVIAYDNDSITQPGSYLQNYGYSTAVLEAPDGIVSYSIPTLPMGANYGDTTGYINSAEWSDCGTPSGLAGVVTAYHDVVALLNAPSSFTIICLHEWDVTFRGKRS